MDRLTVGLVEQGYSTLLDLVLHNYTTCLKRAAAWPKVYFNIARYSTNASVSSTASLPTRRSILQSSYQDTVSTAGDQNRTFNGYMPWLGDMHSSYNLIDTNGRVNPRALDPGHRNSVLGGGWLKWLMLYKVLVECGSYDYKINDLRPIFFLEGLLLHMIRKPSTDLLLAAGGINVQSDIVSQICASMPRFRSLIAACTTDASLVQNTTVSGASLLGGIENDPVFNRYI